jgi:dihydropteroate synthase
MTQTIFQCGRFSLSLARPLVMGILNTTPDSFSDGGRHDDPDRAVEHATRLIDEGADILDIGGESTRPGSAPQTVEEELRRVIPVVRALAGCGKPLSVDTCKTEVMRAALEAGADMINDINGFRGAGAIDAVRQGDSGLCIMHMQGDPRTMQAAPEYGDVVAEVTTFLAQRAAQLEAAGVARERLCVDPGFGFGKTLDHNLALLRRLESMRRETGLPVLAGMSRKSMLGAITGKPVGQRLAASVAAALLAVEAGAAFVRVHDVAETVDALAVWSALRADAAGV